MGVAEVATASPVAATESDDARWRQWKAKGRADDARFQRLVKTVLVDVVGVIALGAALGFAYYL